MKEIVIKNNIKVTPMIIEHWEYKFHRAIHILIKAGYNQEDLIAKIKAIAEAHQEE